MSANDLSMGRAVDDQYLEGTIEEPTPQMWRSAELTCVEHARDTAEARDFLEAIGAAPYRALSTRTGRNSKSKPITREPRTL